MRLPSFSLRRGVHSLEDAIITLSGPGIAISGIIAGVDLLTGGHAMQGLPWLSTAWAICLLLSLDFQILALGARAHQVYTSEKSPARKAIEVSLAAIIACAIGYVSIQMQSIVAQMNAAGTTIDAAAAALGINAQALIWERSGLVIALIFLSGWFRLERGVNQVNQSLVQGSASANSVVVQGFKGRLNQAKQLNHLLNQAKQLHYLTGRDNAPGVQVVQLNQATLNQLGDTVNQHSLNQVNYLADLVSAQVAEIIERTELSQAQLAERLAQPSQELQAVFSRIEQVFVREERTTGTTSAMGSANPRQTQLTGARGRALSAPAQGVQAAMVQEGERADQTEPLNSASSSDPDAKTRILNYLNQYTADGSPEPSLTQIRSACGVVQNTAIRWRDYWRSQREGVQ